VVISDFVEERANKIKSNPLPVHLALAETYYCTPKGKIKGVLTLSEHMLLFDPIKCKENSDFVIARLSWVEPHLVLIPSVH